MKQIIKCPDLRTFFEVKRDLEDRGLIYISNARIRPSRGVNYIGVDEVGLFALISRVIETVRYKNYRIYIVKFCGKLYAVLNNLTLLEDSETVDLESFKKAAQNIKQNGNENVCNNTL